MSIGYIDVRVPKEKLAKLKHEMDTAPSPKKYGRYKAWLHFANLEMWQAQGHHFHYLTECGDVKKLICTCGLYLTEDEESGMEKLAENVMVKLSEFTLDKVQMVKGHRNLEDFVTGTCALIMNYKWVDGTSDYLWTAYCQECGEVLVDKRNEVAKRFVEAHYARCMSRYE